jgi:site-specific DNA recombinase
MERLVVLWPPPSWKDALNTPRRKVRAAIYCRKSSEEGLDQTFNSLHAQRESCLNYIRSQAHEGWIALDDAYDDPGVSGGIIERDAWDKVRAILATNRHRRASCTRAATPALLKGLIFGPDGRAMAPSHTRRRGRLYRFYRTATSLKLCHGDCPIRAVPAGDVEAAVVNQIRTLLRAPEVVVRTWRAAWLQDEQIDEREVVEALQHLDPLWHQLFPTEQARILQLLVARVAVRLDGLEISLRVDGITSVVEELRLRKAAERQAA